MDFGRNAKLCVSTNGNGAVSNRFKTPGEVGVGYSLMPMNAASRDSLGVRYSIASVPNSSRDVASTSATGAVGKAHAWRSPLTNRPKNSSSAERRTPPSPTASPSTSGSYAASPASTWLRNFSHASSDSASSARAVSLSARPKSFNAAEPTAVGCGR